MNNIIYTWIAIFTIVCSSCNPTTKNISTKEVTGSIVVDCISDSTEYEFEVSTISNIDLWITGEPSDVQSEQIIRLMDAYNSSVVVNSIMTDFDLQMRFGDEYENVVKTIESFDFCKVQDSETLSKLIAFKNEILYLLTVELDSIDTDIHNPWKAESEIRSFLASKYHMRTFGTLTEDMYSEIYDNCSSVPEWSNLIKRRGEKNLVAELKHKYSNTTNFDARCIYAIELAHAYEADIDSWADDDFCNPAVPIMESLMKEGNFSLYLYELWLKWRVLYQSSVGSSKDSEIPNRIYNEYRRMCLCSILSHIKNNKEDIMAINEFLVMAYKVNILREGDYDYGNQYAVEEYNLFQEKFR